MEVANLGQAYKACLLPEACYVVCFVVDCMNTIIIPIRTLCLTHTEPECEHRAGKRMKVKSVSESTFNIRAVKCALYVGPFQG
jgi:hypothetical protein